MRKTFKEFDKDFRNQYNISGNYVIQTNSDMEEALYELYGAERYDIDYENRVIELF